MTHQLTQRNFQRLVEDSNDIWIVIVYLDTDDRSVQIMNFWDEIAKDYPFIQFGRINFASQPKLVSQLPFRVEEIPFILSFLPDGTSEYFEFDAYSDVSHSSQLVIRRAEEVCFRQHCQDI